MKTTPPSQAEKKKEIHTTSTVLCHWCKKQVAEHSIKVSPKRSKPACSLCYEMMMPEPPKMEPSNVDKVKILRGVRCGEIGEVESFDYIPVFRSHLYLVRFENGESGYYPLENLKIV